MLFTVVSVLSCIYCKIRRKRNADAQHRHTQRDTSFDATFSDYLFSFHDKDVVNNIDEIEMHHLPYFVQEDEFEKWSDDDLSTLSSVIVSNGRDINHHQYGGITAVVAKSVVKQDMLLSLSGMMSTHARRAPVASVDNDEVCFKGFNYNIFCVGKSNLQPGNNA